MEQTKLEVMVAESGLDTTKAQFILTTFQDYFVMAAEWEGKAKEIVVTDGSQLMQISAARSGRLFLREKRIAIEKVRKNLKEQSLREGKAIDGIANVLKALIVPIEQYLQSQEDFVKIKEEAERKAAEEEQAHKDEEERLAKEKAEAEERDRIKLENIRLAAEAEERERLHAIERQKAQAAIDKKERQLAEEKAKAEEALRKTKERAAAERATATLKEEAAKERAAGKLKEEQERRREAEKKLAPSGDLKIARQYAYRIKTDWVSYAAGDTLAQFILLAIKEAKQ